MRASRNAIVDGPHSSRVAATVPANLQLSKLNTASPLPSPPASPLSSPPIPPRSPLRPKVNTAPTDTRSTSINRIADILDMTLAHSRSLGSIPILLESHSGRRPKTPDKPLPMPPRSSTPPLPGTDREETRRTAITLSALSPPPITKREHALLELLSSERAYASDLALIREVHIPLALGTLPSPLHCIRALFVHSDFWPLVQANRQASTQPHPRPHLPVHHQEPRRLRRRTRRAGYRMPRR